MMRQRFTQRFQVVVKRFSAWNIVDAFIAALLFLIFGDARTSAAADQVESPNVVIILCDDLGYGDLGVYGSKINRTPRIDQMAADGFRLTSFYASASVCTPSRASLLTGCYPQRVDMAEMQPSGFRSVLLRLNQKGLNPSETTIAEVCQQKGYATACFGKWHVGEQPPFLPTRQGFDAYFGTPGSNNFSGGGGLPLIEGEAVVERPTDQDTLTKRYTERAVSFIEEHRNQPFFLYLSHNMPHDPLHASDAFRGRTGHGIYSDAIEEIDWSVGQVLDCLDRHDLSERTFVYFTSDNGGEPRFGGVNEPLRGSKGQTWEGGMRVPGIAWWPGTISPGQVSDEVATIMDLFPTVHRLVHGESFVDAVIDGHDLMPLLTRRVTQSAYQAVFFYDRDQLQAVRSGQWKLHLPNEQRFANHYRDDTFAIDAELYDLLADIGETTNVADRHPDVVSRLTRYAKHATAVFGTQDAPSRYVRPAGMVAEVHEHPEKTQ